MKEPNLDQWSTGFALIAFLGLFIAPLLYSQAGQRKAQVRYVVAIVALFSGVLLYYVLWWSRYLQFVPYLNGAAEVLFFLFGPLFYFYLQELRHRPVTASARWLHFLPFGAAAALHVVFVVLANGWPATGPMGSFPKLLPLLSLVHLSVYAGAILRLQGAFAALRREANWARWYSFSYGGFVLANWSYYLLVQLAVITPSWDYAISLSMAGFIGLVAVLAYVQPAVFKYREGKVSTAFPAGPSFPLQVSKSNAPAPDAAPAETVSSADTVAPPNAATPEVAPLEATTPAPAETRYRNSGLPPHVAVRLAQQLDELMRAEKLYRVSELRLDTLAERLNLSRHHLSQVLNEQLGMNFFEYINALRIEEAKELLIRTSRQELNIIEVAYEVGFNNKVSFNKSFKNATGLTPSEFRQAHNGNPGRDLLPTAIAGG
ncbi:MAG TPA: helix-turn-helix domain-containing protein [Hymenobacter sp.]|jgi:AraC-like DNA-binding protein|uniref:helix-turn-helix domain-containing protein n=1 Tax=Hymenobacter sp. TaxID=1898978 RepID=UPI002ED792AD